MSLTATAALPASLLATLSSADPDKWTVSDVCVWLGHVKQRLQQHTALFKQKGWNNGIQYAHTERNVHTLIYSMRIHSRHTRQ